MRSKTSTARTAERCEWDGTERRARPRRADDPTPRGNGIPKRNIRLTQAVTAAVSVTAAMLIASVVWLVFLADPPPRDAIHFSAQRVEAVSETGRVSVPVVYGFDEPSILVGDDVPIRGERCVESWVDEPFEARAHMWWERVEPTPGFRVTVLDDFDSEITDLGCVPLTFSNPMPSEVVARIVADQQESEVWRIVGSVDPIGLEGGRVATFATESFIVVNDRPFVEAEG